MTAVAETVLRCSLSIFINKYKFKDKSKDKDKDTISTDCCDRDCAKVLIFL